MGTGVKTSPCRGGEVRLAGAFAKGGNSDEQFLFETPTNFNNNDTEISRPRSLSKIT
jgi:hypothetical protein